MSTSKTTRPSTQAEPQKHGSPGPPAAHCAGLARQESGLNIIENVWAIMTDKQTRDGDGERLRTEEMWRKVERHWERLRARPNLFEKLADSVPRRLEQVMEKAGGMTSY